MTAKTDLLLLNYLAEVRVIGFDLDDTLWDNHPVIRQAEATQFEVLVQACPGLTTEQLSDLYQRQVTRLIQEDPQGYQDMTRLRQKALLALCHQLGVAEHWAKQAFAQFYTARQAFRAYPEALSLLQRLATRYRLVAISNGNAEIKGTPLATYFDFHWRAGVQGEAKPSADMLLKACRYYRITPQQLAYIGDNPETDGQAALNAGCLGILIHSGGHTLTRPDDRLFGFHHLSALIAWLDESGLFRQ